MNNFSEKIKKNDGYAILFAVIIVSIITLLSFGLSSTTYKELVLSSLASDSQMSYFQSDTATECAIYSDLVLGMGPSTPSPWNCGVNSTGTDNYSFNIGTMPGGSSDLSYRVTNSQASTLPCFEFDVDKPTSTSSIVYARGYNNCDKTNGRTVEREIRVTY